MCHRYDINDMISGKLQLQLVPDEGQSHIMGDIDLKVGTADAPFLNGVYKFPHCVSAAAGPPLEQSNQIGQWWLLRYVTAVSLHAYLHCLPLGWYC